MKRRVWLLLLIVLCAVAVRVWQLDSVPPGWSDDELSNIFVIAQKIFSGDFSVYYTDATGLEAPYHILSGVFLRLLGFNVMGIRLLSVYLGLLTVPLTYQVGRILFNRHVGLVAAAALAVSFWSLIYSRVNLRHIALPVMALATFYAFWQAAGGVRGRGRGTERGYRAASIGPYFTAGLLLGLSLYTYFASRGLPLILLAFVLYLALFDRKRLQLQWRGIVVVFVVALVVAVPLIITIQQETGADARVAEVAVPLVQASEGNFEPLWRHIRVTLSMFHGDGDDEHLYNIPHRPVFGAPGAILLWLGVALAAWLALQPLKRRLARAEDDTVQYSELAAAFALLWWAAGISPGFLSVPPASLGHNILAQPVTYILLALPLWRLHQYLRIRRAPYARWLPVGLALLVPGTIAVRDLPDYFVEWPRQGMVRFLYHADLEEVARYVAEEGEPEEFAIAGLLAGPWARLALDLALENAGVEQALPRWYHAQRAAFLAIAGESATAFSGFPHVQHAYEGLYERTGARAGSYHVARVDADYNNAPLACFENGLCLLEVSFEAGVEGQRHTLHATWGVQQPLQLPPIPLLSKPPPPDVYAGPRLLVFTQHWRGDGQYISGDDGLWVDPLTLQAGDVFRQQHYLGTEPAREGDYLLLGLYDPMDGQRILTTGGEDHVRVPLSPPDGQ